MERKYDLAFFKEKIKKIREARPDISISTDVIVGFPYESDLEYQNSVEFVEYMDVSYTD